MATSNKCIFKSSLSPKSIAPSLINPSRKRRIAKGAGVDISEVNRLVKQIENQKKMMKQLSGMMGGKGKRRFGGFPGGMPGGGRFPF